MNSAGTISAHRRPEEKALPVLHAVCDSIKTSPTDGTPENKVLTGLSGGVMGFEDNKAG
jgi:hypothetical protein